MAPLARPGSDYDRAVTSSALPSPGVVACDLCGRSDRGTTLFEATDLRFGGPGRFDVVRCECGLVRTEPQPEDMAAFYPTDDYYSYAPPREPSSLALARVRTAYGLEVNGDRRVLARLWRARLLPGLPPGPPGDVLDVGCGSGETLLVLQQAGWRCQGIDISESAVAAARAAGLDGVRSGDLLEAGYEAKQFDAVRFWHSLEHMRSPRAQLDEARRILRPGGSITIGVPNIESLLSRTLRERSFYLDVPRHLWHFDPRTLSRLVASSGFSVQSAKLVSTPSALTGSLARLTGSRGDRALSHKAAWYAGLPVAAALDVVGLGDGLELVAHRKG